MRTPILLIVFSCFLTSCASTPIVGNSVIVSSQGDFLIRAEGSTSAIQMPKSNFNLVYSNSANQGRYSYYIFGNPQNFIISFTVETALRCNTNVKCRDQYLVGLEKFLRVARDFKKYEKGDAAVVEYFLPTYENEPVNQQNLFATYVRDGYVFDVHISKIEFSQKDRELFNEIFDSLAFIKSPERLGEPEPTHLRHFPIPDHGVLVLSVPNAWKDQIRYPPRRLPPTIVLAPNSGNAFMILITALWKVKEGLSQDDPQQFRASVEKTAKWARVFSPNQFEEKNPPLIEMPGTTSKGYYYSLTDKNPRPGEYKYVTQGIIPVDELRLTFTILTNEPDSNIVRDSLHMLGTAAQRK